MSTGNVDKQATFLVHNLIVRSLAYLSRLPHMSDTFIFSRTSSTETMTSNIAHSISETKREISGRVTNESKKVMWEEG
jgi:hypothetical protein